MSKIISVNRVARFNYEILEKIEAGIVLKGTEVKSLRDGKINIRDSFARVDKGEIFLYNMYIGPYEQGNIYNVDSVRTRKLLLNRPEIDKLYGKLSQRGLTLVPLGVYFKRGIAKVELGLGKRKKIYDKREIIKKRDLMREWGRSGLDGGR